MTDPFKAYMDAHPLKPLTEDEARTFVTLVWAERHVWHVTPPTESAD